MNRPSYLLFKQCSKCGEIKHISKFYKDKNRKYGVMKICKECRKIYEKKYKDKHREEIKEKQRQSYYENIEERREYHRNWKREHKENVAKTNKKQEMVNPHNRLNSHNRRRLKLENQGRGINKIQWQEMMLFFDFKCAYSGEYIGGNSDKRTIDHIVALDNGGEHEIWNLVPMYQPYNSSKRNNNMLEWYLEQEYFDIDRLTRIYEWRIYAYWKWKE